MKEPNMIDSDLVAKIHAHQALLCALVESHPARDVLKVAFHRHLELPQALRGKVEMEAVIRTFDKLME
jgi:hypothetical protein